MANKTVEQIYAYAQDLLKFDGTDVGLAGLEEDRVINFVSDLDKQFAEEFYTRGIVLPTYLASHYGTDTVTGTTLSAATAAAASSFTIGTSTALATSGAGVIYDNNQFDIFTHTANSSGTVSGVPASGSGSLAFAHDSGNAVERLYPLPSDFGRPRPGKGRGDGVLVNGIPYYEVPEFPVQTCFSIYDTGTTKYLWMPHSQSGQIMIFYDMSPDTLTTTADTISFPDPYHWYHVWGLVALFRQIMDESYIPQREQSEMLKVVNQALMKRSAGKPIRASSAFFGFRR